MLRPYLEHKLLQLLDDVSHQRRQQQARQLYLGAIAGRQNCQIRPVTSCAHSSPQREPATLAWTGLAVMCMCNPARMRPVYA